MTLTQQNQPLFVTMTTRHQQVASWWGRGRQGNCRPSIFGYCSQILLEDFHPKMQKCIRKI